LIPAMIVPVLTRYDLLNRMIESINYPVKDLVIIDNGAKTTDWSPTWNQWVSKIWHLKFPTNLGVPASWNLGIKSLPMSDYWLIANFDIEWGGDSLKLFAEQSNPETLLLSNGNPEWCVFSLGSKIVEQVGLFDESFVPAYFEDTDYERRATHFGCKIERSFIPISHENSSTLKAGFQKENELSFSANEQYLSQKRNNQDFSEGRWDIKRRRRLGWD
jgi:GT2 family glycosyltransferase